MSEEEIKSEEKKVEDSEYEEVKEGDIFEFKEKGASLEGNFFRMESDIGKHKSKLYSVKTTEGKVLKFWGSTILDDRMSQIEFNTNIRVVFNGMVTPDSGNEYKDFTVLKKRATEEK